VAARIRVTRRRGRFSVVSVAQVLQHHTGARRARAREWAEQLEAGEPLVLELEDEFAAHDMASMMEALGAWADVEEGDF
jgi:hypothetical protein